MSDPARVPMGAIIKAHGIRGEAVMDCFADSPALLKPTVFLELPGHPPREAAVQSFRPHQGRLLVQFEGIDSRNEAERLRGATVSIPRERLPQPGRGEAYLHDLIGLRVLLGETDEELGVLDAIDAGGAQELWRILTGSGKEILFPAVPQFVLDIDPEKGIVRISPPPGLLEL